MKKLVAQYEKILKKTPAPGGREDFTTSPQFTSHSATICTATILDYTYSAVLYRAARVLMAALESKASFRNQAGIRNAYPCQSPTRLISERKYLIPKRSSSLKRN